MIPEVSSSARLYLGQPPCGGIGFLAVDGHIAQFAATGFDELFTLHEHAARASTRVVHLAVVRAEHGHQRLDDAGRGVKLPATLAFGAGEHAPRTYSYTWPKM